MSKNEEQQGTPDEKPRRKDKTWRAMGEGRRTERGKVKENG